MIQQKDILENSKKNVIHIFGASGSGTSTLGKYISEQLDYTFIDTDDYFWLPTDVPFTKARQQKERIEMLKRDINNNKNVVISGFLVGWADEIIPLITLAIRLVTSSDVRLKRINEREFNKYGNRILPQGDMYEQYWKFIERASKYDDGDYTVRSKKLHDLWQEKLNCKIAVLSGEDSLKHNCEIIKKLATL